VRSNLGFEGIALTPDGRTLYVANEESLAQDGPIATPGEGTVVRILAYRSGPGGWQPTDEAAYRTEPIFATPDPPTAFGDNGISAMLYSGHLWPDTDLLTMERAFVTGVGNDVRIFGVRLAGAQNTATIPALPSPFTGSLVSRTLLVRMSDVAIAADNLEGLTYGPRLPNGKPTLIVMSDDNFSESQPPQVNQFVLFELNDTAVQPTTPTIVPPGLPPAPAPTVGPARPPAPVQAPAALPQTGTLSIGGPLAVLGLLLLGFGLGLKRALRRRSPTVR
jgi:3-phytase